MSHLTSTPFNYSNEKINHTQHHHHHHNHNHLVCKHQHTIITGNKAAAEENKLEDDAAPSLFMLKESFKEENTPANVAPTDRDSMSDFDLEKLIELSYKPIDVILGGCLKLNKVTSRIILNPKPDDPAPPKPKNLIIEWEKMRCVVKERITDLGVEKCDPNEYIEKFGPELIKPEKMPEIANKAAVEAVEKHGKQLAALNSTKYFNELEGDVHALTLIDLDKEGLSEYKYLLEKLNTENK